MSHLTLHIPIRPVALRLFAALAAMLLLPLAGRAQADAQFSHYFEIPGYYNPGAVGTTDLVKIRAGMRMQWVGIKNAPQTFAGTVDMPFKLLEKRWGVGALIQQESLGLYRNMTLGAQVAYKQPLFKGVLSIGARVGMLEQSFKGSEAFTPGGDDFHQPSDEAIPTQDIKGNGLDLGAGLFYTYPAFWAALSATHLNSPTVKMNAESGQNTSEKNYEFNFPRTFYFMAGSNIKLKNTLFEVMPSILVKSDLVFTSWEATARCRYNKLLTGGVGYRWRDCVYITLGAEFKNVYLGYSYDIPTTALIRGSMGSHEIFVGYSLKLDLSDRNRNRHKSIRIM